MTKNASSEPYATLGTHLKFLREQHKETLAEVCGAVELDQTAYERIEDGHERPAEDILMLLINHFNMQDQEAVQLWELAGYEGDTPNQWRPEEIIAEAQAHSATKPLVVLFGIDARTMYTDSAEIVANQAGVTLHFGQSTTQGTTAPIAKVGMSYEQAEKLLQSLQRAMLHGKYNSGPRALPPARDQGHNQNSDL